MSTLAGDLVVGVTADVTKAQQQIEHGLEQSGANAEKHGAGMGKKLATGLVGAFAAVQVGQFIGDSITAASDLSETANKIATVFGPATESVNEFAANSAAALGQSKQAALDAAATFGVFGKAGGLAGQDLAKFSTDLVGLSSDLASFYNEDPGAAAEAIGAAFRGEAEPLRRFGVLLSADAIAAQALSMGLVDAKVDTLAVAQAQMRVKETSKAAADATKKYGEDSDEAAKANLALEAANRGLEKAMGGVKVPLTQNQKLLATQALIMEQTGVAQGDFGKTSEGLANQQRILAAEIENQKAALGQALLPAMLEVIKVIRPVVAAVLPALGAALTAIGPVLAGLVSGLAAVAEQVVEWKVPILAIAGVIGTLLLPLFITWAVSAATAAAASVAAWVSSAAGAVAAGLTTAATAAVIVASWVSMAVQSTLAAIKIAAAWVMSLGPIGLIIAAIAAIVAAVLYAWNHFEGFREVVLKVWEAIKDAAKAVADWFTDTLWPTLQKVWDGIQAGVELLVKIVRGYFDLWVKVVTIAMDAISTVISTVWNAVKAGVEFVVDAIRWVIDKYVRLWLGVFDLLWGWVSKVAEVFGAVKDKITEWMGIVRDWVSEKVAAVVGAFRDALAFVVDKAAEVFGLVRDKIGEWIGIIKGYVEDKVGQIVSAFASIAGSLVGVGRDIVEGLWRGISGAWDWVMGKVRGLTDKLPAIVRKALGIGSPSKVFATIGGNIVEGIQVGMADQRGDLLRDMRGLVPYDQIGMLDTLGSVRATTTAKAGPVTVDTRSLGAPVVQVFIGNEELDSYLVRVQKRANEAAASRLVAAGV